MMENLKIEVHNELLAILSYWKKKVVDHTNGGFLGRIDGFGIITPNANKGIILNTRILWTFSAAYLLTGNEDDKLAAHRAYQYLDKFWDHEFGGVYWEVDASGKPLDTKKQIYAQAFAIYSLCEYYKIAPLEEVKEKAVSLFRLIENYSYDEQLDGYLEAFDRKWNLLDDLRLSDKDANEKKTMNTHLHVLEAYTNLFRIWKDETLEVQLKNLIFIFIEKIFDNNTKHLNLFFDENWGLKSSIYSFGHDIEASWLLQEAAEVLDDEQLMERTRKIAVEVCNMILEEGLDMDGAIFNEGIHGRIIDPDKHWWPQAEAMVGFINVWQITHDKAFFDAALRLWNFIKAAIVDKVNGEWYFRVSRTWQPYMDEDKAGFWKCPYHNCRACMEILHRI